VYYNYTAVLVMGHSSLYPHHHPPTPNGRRATSGTGPLEKIFSKKPIKFLTPWMQISRVMTTKN